MPLVLELRSDRGVRVRDGRVAAWTGTGTASETGTPTPISTAREDDPARRPTLIVDAGTGIPAIRFAAGERLVVPNAPELHPGKRDLTVFVVARTRSVTAAHRIVHHGNTTSRDRGWSIFTEPSRAGVAVRFRAAGRGAGAQSHGHRAATDLGETSVYELRLAGKQVRARLGGARMTDGGGGALRRRVRGAVVPDQDLILGGGSGPLDLFAVVVVIGDGDGDPDGDPDRSELARIRRDLESRYPPERPAAIDDLRGDTTVFRWGREAPSTRIPALARCDDGTLLAFAELRSRASDSGHIGIGVKRSTDGGAIWGPVIVVKDDGRHCSRNPVPIVDRRTGRVVLVTCWDRAGDDEHRIESGGARVTRVFVQHSDDRGRTWSESRDITDEVRLPGWRWYATGPGGVEQLASGRMVVPCNHSDPGNAGARHRSHAIISDDGGATWRLGGIVDAPGTNEAQLAQRPDGAIVMYMRNQAEGRKQLALSRDEGESWEPTRRIPELVGTACQGDILAVGGLLLATSHQHLRRRAELAVNVSIDGGATWPAYTVVSPTSAAYSDLVELEIGPPDAGDGDAGEGAVAVHARIGMLFERDDARIAFTTFAVPPYLRGT